MLRLVALLNMLFILTLSACQDTAAPSLDPRDAENDTAIADIAPPEADVAPLPDIAEPDAAPPRDAAAAPRVIGSVDTALGADVSPAGTSTQVTCTVFDTNGDQMDRVETRVEISPRPGWAFDDQENTLYAHIVGEYSVRCVVARSGIIDDSPIQWRITPGPTFQTIATAVPLDLRAGEPAQVGCAAYDVYGNEVDASDLEPTTVTNAAPIEDRVFRATTANVYRVICPSGGARTTAAVIEVSPGPAQSIVAAADPVREIYASGTIVTIVTRATDAFGNLLAAPDVRLSTNPGLPAFGLDRFLLNADGRYTVTAALHLEDDTIVDTASLELIVDSNGPLIDCISPSPNSMLVLEDEVTLTGQASDPARVGFVDVDGVPVAIDAEGRFSHPVNPRRGVNIHTVSATDEFGNTSEVYCAYFAADSYLPEDAVFRDGIILDLRRLAVDDGPPADPLESLTDLFRVVLQSDALIDTLNAAGLSANPILESRCFQDTWVGCIFRAGADFRSLAINGARTVSLDLIDGGMAISARFNDISLNVSINGTLSTRGDVDVSHLTVTGTFSLNLVDGVPQLVLRDQPAPTVTLGNLSTDFSGVAGFLVDAIFPLVRSTIREELSDTLRGFIFDELDSILSGALAGLDLSSFGAGFDVESPAGDPVLIELQTSTTTMNANPNRLRIGVGTRGIGPQGQALPSAGVPIFGDTSAIEHGGAGTLGAIIHLGLVNQLMHTLWRAGFFAIEDAGAIAGDAADGFNFSFDLLVPPAIEGTDDEDSVRLHLGPARAQLSYPGVIDQPIGLLIAAVMSLDVGLIDGNLSFGGGEGIVVEELHLLIEDVAMGPEAREAIEDTFGVLVRNLVDSALSGALPALPVPEIPIPAELVSPPELPADTTLGIREPSLEVTPARLFLDGTLRQ